MFGWEREEAWQRFADAQDLRLALADLRRDLPDLKLYVAHKRIAALELQLKYRPDQPRVPAGFREGGQWTRDRSGTPSAAQRREQDDDFGGEIATALGVGVADAAERAPPKVGYRVNLLVHEALGGHTILRHVGKSDEFLRRRLRYEPGIPAASSFTSVAAAEKVINAALSIQAAALSAMVASPEASHARVEVRFDRPIGRIWVRGAASPVATPALRVYVRKSVFSPEGFIVVTASPTEP